MFNIETASRAKRGFPLASFFLFMAAANLLLRWCYVLTELMVEYWVYPSMAWLGLPWLHLMEMEGWPFDPAAYDAELTLARKGLQKQREKARPGVP